MTSDYSRKNRKNSYRKKQVNLRPIRERADRQSARIKDIRIRVIVLEAMIGTLREQVLTLSASVARK